MDPEPGYVMKKGLALGSLKACHSRGDEDDEAGESRTTTSLGFYNWGNEHCLVAYAV